AIGGIRSLTHRYSAARTACDPPLGWGRLMQAASSGSLLQLIRPFPATNAPVPYPFMDRFVSQEGAHVQLALSVAPSGIDKIHFLLGSQEIVRYNGPATGSDSRMA